MSIAKALELRKQRAQLIKEAQTLIDKTEGISDADRTEFDGKMARAAVLKADIDRFEAAAAAEADITETRTATGERREAAVGEAEAEKVKLAVSQYRTAARRGRSALLAMDPQNRNIIEGLNERYWGAMKEHLRSKDPSDETRAILNGRVAELRDMGVGTGSLGGFLVPQGFVYEVEDAMKYYGDMLNVSTIMDTATGNTMPYPTDNDTTNKGEIVGEGQQVSDQDIAIGQINFGAWKFSTKLIKISVELLQDSAFDLETFVKGKFGERLGRILNQYFTTGTGTGQPNGALTAATAGPTAVGSSGNTGGVETGGTTFGSTDLIALEFAVDKAYRQGARYSMNDSSVKQAREILDKFGRPLFQPSLAVGAPDTLNGYPVSTNNDMPTIAVNAKTILFGQFKKYTIRRVKELAIVKLSERFADYGQVAFIGFARYDGQLLDAGTHPLAYLTQASS